MVVTDSGIQPREAAELIDAVCARAFQTWEKCLSLAREGDENLVVLRAHYHLAEELDAVALLVRQREIEPAKLQLRAAFESLLTLEYVMESDTRRRAHAWLVADILERIKSWERLDPTTDEGRAFAALQEKEGYHLPVFEGAADRRATLQNMLEIDPRWTEAYDEYKLVKQAAGKRPVDWYELFGGPTGLRALAVHLGHGTHYEILYRMWAWPIHGTDAVQRTRPGNSGTAAIHLARYIPDLEMVLNLSIAFGLSSMRLLVRFFMPEDWPELSAWYAEHISSKWPPAAEGPSPASPEDRDVDPPRRVEETNHP